ncbi:hypothetical protein ZWY2020_015302 [Hordeum vulgare]|nr:hypothetical protein ZWY2020_015302 [Hordeum vulgare]
MVVRNKLGSIFSHISLLCRNRRCRLEAVARRFFSKYGGHVSTGPSPPPPQISRRRRPEATPWHNDRKLAPVMALAVIAGCLTLTYGGETVPYSGRTNLAVLSHKEARRRDEADFAKFKRDNASKIVDPCNPLTVHVRRIANLIIRAAHHGLAIRELQASKHARTSRQHLTNNGLHWMEGLEWEVVVLRDWDDNAMCFPGAGKIVVNTQLLRNFRTDAEIAVTLAHEVGHVIGRHSSGIFYWLYPILEEMPLMFLLVLPFTLPFKRRHELEADHIGMLLLAAAGVDPTIAVVVRKKKAELRGEEDSTLTKFLSYFSTHPSSKKRWMYLSQPRVMDEALDLYRQVVTHAEG